MGYKVSYMHSLIYVIIKFEWLQNSCLLYKLVKINLTMPEDACVISMDLVGDKTRQP